MKLKILTPDRVVLEEDGVESVTAHSTEGSFGVLQRHLPLVAPLDIALLEYVKNGQKLPAAVMGGVFRTDGETVTVLTGAAELAAEVDALRAEEAKKRAEARLRERVEAVDIQRAELSLARALVRLQLAGRR